MLGSGELSLKTYKRFCRMTVEVVSSYVWNEKIKSVCVRKKRLLDERGENGFNIIQMFRMPQCIQEINSGMPDASHRYGVKFEPQLKYLSDKLL